MRVGQRSHDAAEAEFTDFVAGSQRALRRAAYLMCGDWHRAEDIVQTALARMYVHWSRVEHREGAGPYARRAVVNAAIDDLRRVWRREHSVAQVPEGAASVGDEPLSAQLDARVAAALRALPPRQRAVIVLRYVEDMDVAQTADILSISSGTVKSQAARGLATLRAELSRTAVAVGEGGL